MPLPLNPQDEERQNQVSPRINLADLQPLQSSPVASAPGEKKLDVTDLKPIEATPEIMSKTNELLGMQGSMERSLPGEIATSFGRGVVQLAQVPVEAAEFIGSDVLGIKPIKSVTDPIIRAMEGVQKGPWLRPSSATQESLMEHPEQLQSINWWAAHLPQAAVSMASFFLGGAAAKGAGMALKYGKALQEVNTALKAAEVAGDVAQVASLTQKLGALTVGMNKITRAGGYGASIAMEAAGAKQMVREYEDAHPDKKVGYGTKILAIMGTGLLAGSLEALSIEHIFNSKPGQHLINKLLSAVAWEGGTEGAQQLIANAFAKYGYNPGQDIMDGVLESIVIGGALGLLGGGYEQARHKMAEAKEKAIQQGQQTIPGMEQPAEARAGYRTGPTLETAMRQPLPMPTEAMPPGAEVPEARPHFLGPAEPENAALIFHGNELADVLREYPFPDEAIPRLAAKLGSLERGERFYGLWRRGDAKAALNEFWDYAPPKQRVFGPYEYGGTILGDIVSQNLPPEQAITELATVLNSYEEAQQFYDLWQRGDARTALAEFEQYTKGYVPPEPKRPAAPLGPTGAEVTEQAREATTPAPGAVETQPPGAPPSPGPTAATPTAPEPITGKPEPPIMPPGAYPGGPEVEPKTAAEPQAEVPPPGPATTPGGEPGPGGVAPGIGPETPQTPPPGPAPGGPEITPEPTPGTVPLPDTSSRPKHPEVGADPYRTAIKDYMDVNAIGHLTDQVYETVQAYPEFGQVTHAEDNLREALIQQLLPELGDQKIAFDVANGIIGQLHMVMQDTTAAEEHQAAQGKAAEKRAGEMIPYKLGNPLKRGWVGNVIQGDNYLSDGHMVFPTAKANQKLVDKLKLREPGSDVVGFHPEEKIVALWNQLVQSSNTDLEILGVRKVGEGKNQTPILYLVSPDGQQWVMNPYKFDLLYHLTGFDSMKGSTPDKPIVLYREGQPVGALMGMDIEYHQVDIPKAREVVGGRNEMPWGKKAPAPKGAPASTAIEGVAYRYGEAAHPRGATIADVLRYETEELGNNIGVTKKDIAKYEGIPASRGLWITKTREDAQRYGPDAAGVKEITLPKGTQVIARDAEGGHFVLLPETKSGVQPAPEGAAPQPTPQRFSDTPHGKVAMEIRNLLNERIGKPGSKPITAQELFRVADKAYGGTQAEGKYTPKDAFDAMELGVNLYIRSRAIFDPSTNTGGRPQQAVEDLTTLIKHIPTQSRRTGEMLEFQQFSTPPPLAYAVAWAAKLNENDVVLEPSAGIGGLAVFAQVAGVKEVVVNELSPRRAEILKLLGIDKVYTENAEHLHAILPADVRPSVVMMNPPFSATAGRKEGERKSIHGAKHIEQALKRLEPGGRLVAIVGRGMAVGKPTFTQWWTKIKKEYNVRANVSVSGKNYAKYGTTFDNQLLVIDKTGPTQGEVVTGTVKNLADLFPLLEDVRDERRPLQEVLRPNVSGEVEGRAGTQPKAPEQAGAAGPQAGEGGTAVHGPGGTVNPQPAPVGAGKQEGEAGGTPGATRDTEGLPGRHGELEPGGRDAGVRGERPGRAGETPGTGTPGPSEAGGGGDRTTPQPTHGGKGQLPEGRTPGLTEVQTKEAERTEGELSDSIYESYKPQRLKIPGAKQHPGHLVQSAAMAAVEPPAPTYKPNLPQQAITSGKLSEPQLEAVVYSGQAHQDELPDGTRKGFMIGDGTGVGKGREAGGILWDNYNQGRKKALWISASNDLFKSARRDVAGTGWDPDVLFQLKKTKTGSAVQANEGVMFLSYDTLRSGAGFLKDRTKGEPGAKQDKSKSRIEQIIEWAGPDFDGVIIFDESHKMGNATEQKGSRGKKEASLRALAGVELQKRLPNARVVYMSATGATEVDNLAYAERLGLWGGGTAFATKQHFINQIKGGGVAAMELVAKDMKAMGVYMARSLAYQVPGDPKQTVNYDRLEHTLSPQQREVYNECAGAWQLVLQNIREALVETGQQDSPQARGAAYSQFWGAHQRFFNQVITSMQMPSAIKHMEQMIAEGLSPVISLVNTHEAAQKRELARMTEESDLDDLDITPRQALMQYVEHSFPTQQYEEYTDEDGNTKMRGVYDSAGNPVHNPEMVAKKQELMQRLGAIRVPEGPLDMVVNHFGPKVVAEVTGRKERIVRHGGQPAFRDGRSDAKCEADAQAFMDDQKRILVFSDKGGTGATFNASLEAKNQRHRVHYLVQPGWRADNAIQQFGRTHRTNQATAPTYILCTTDLQGQRRFISSIARRLDQLGALTKGQRQTGSGGVFQAKDNLENKHAWDGLYNFFLDLHHGKVKEIGIGEFQEQTGLQLLTPEGNLREDLPTITQFLNRLLSMDVDTQNATFNAFYARMEKAVENAAARGELDVGMENLRPDQGGRIEKVSEQMVYTDPKTEAETKYVEVDEINPTRFRQNPLEHGTRFYQNARSERVWVRSDKAQMRTTAEGDIVNQYAMYGITQSAWQQVREGEFKDRDKWIPLTEAQGKALWAEEMRAAPKEQKTRHHLISGAILPIWDRLKGDTKIVRVQTKDGDRFLGRVIKRTDLQEVLKNLGATTSEKVSLAPKEIHGKILDENNLVTLANGWRLKRSRVAGEYRIELTGPDVADIYYLRNREGLIVEMIDHKTRFFVPVDQSGVGIIANIVRNRPVVGVAERPAAAAGKYCLGGLAPAPAEGGTLTRQEIQKAFGPHVQVEEMEGAKAFSIKLPNDKLILVLTDQDLTSRRDEILRTYGRELKPGEKVAGEWRFMSVGGVLALAKGEGVKTLDHETFHAACDLVLTQKELQAILKEHGDWETAARAYENWTPKEAHTIFQKIVNFFKRLAGVLRPTAQGTFARIKSGEVWIRTSVGPSTGQTGMFSLGQAMPTRETIDTFKSQRVAEREAKAPIKERFKGLTGWFADKFTKFYSEVVSGEAALERLGEKAAAGPREGVTTPGGQNLQHVLSRFRGREGWATQALLGDKEKGGVFHDVTTTGVETRDTIALREQIQQEITEKGKPSNRTMEKWDRAMDRAFFTGEAKKVGENLTTRLEPLRELAKRTDRTEPQVMSDFFDAFMVAQRDLELAGEHGNRVPGSIKGTTPDSSKAVLTALEQEYGAEFKVFKETADAVREWCDQTLLQPLVTVGRLSQEVYQQIKASNQFYIPFFRLMEEMADKGFVANNANLFEVRNIPIKTIKGSERLILPPLEMLQTLAYNVADTYGKAKVARVLSEIPLFSEVAEGQVEIVRAKYFKVPTMLKQETDPKLRGGLMAIADALKVDVQVRQTLKRVRRTLGYFTQQIRQDVRTGVISGDEGGYIELMFGTTEKTLAHEVGHAIDAKYDLISKLMATPRMKQELRAIADQRLGDIPSDSYRKYVRKREEQVAEFVNRYINANGLCKQLAPEATRAFEKFLNATPELKGMLSLRPSQEVGTLEVTGEAWTRSPFAPQPNCLLIYQNGVPYWLKLNPDLYQAAAGMNTGDVGILVKVAREPARWLKSGAVLNPEFVARNFPRDIIMAKMLSRYGFSFVEWTKDVFRLVAKDEQAQKIWAEWQAGGGAFSDFASSQMEAIRVTADDISGARTKKVKYTHNPIEALREVSSFLENITRYSVYRQALAKGANHDMAIHEARTVTLDFHRFGGNPYVRILGMIIPFFNPAIQGVDKLATELRGPNKGVVMQRLLLGITLPSILLWLLTHRDKRIKELENWERNYFWHFPLGKDGPIVRLPKPFEVGIFFGSVPQRMLDWAVDKDVNGIRSVLMAAADAALPSFMPTIVRPFVEGGSNWNFFMDRPIEDASMQDLPKELRAKPWTSETAKTFSKHVGAMAGISPVQFEHYIRTLGGGLAANYMMPGIDLVLRKTGILDDVPQPTQDAIQKVWGVRAYFAKMPTGMRAKSVNDFFQEYQNIVQADLGWKTLWNSGQMEDLDKFLGEHPEAMFAKVARRTVLDMGKLKKERNQIYASKTLNEDQKREKLDALDARLVTMAQTANAFFAPDVVDSLTLPPRSKNGKALDMPDYYKTIAEPAAEAFKKVQKAIPAWEDLSLSERGEKVAAFIKKEMSDYKLPVKVEKPSDITKPYRFANIFDTPTTQEKAEWNETVGGLFKVKPELMTGFRLRDTQKKDKKKEGETRY